jgi:Tfp pilus assembly protein PilO
MDDKDTKSNQEVIEYKERLAMYSDMENELKLNLVTKESTIANLTQAQDINARQITALLEVLERQVTTTLPALIVQWQGEVNGLETFPDDPTFRNVVSQQVIEPSEKDILFVSM